MQLTQGHSVGQRCDQIRGVIVLPHGRTTKTATSTATNPHAYPEGKPSTTTAATTTTSTLIIVDQVIHSIHRAR